MPHEQLTLLNSLFGLKAVRIDGAPVMWCRRDRFYWISFALPLGEGATIERRDLYDVVRLLGRRPPVASWATPSATPAAGNDALFY